MFSSVGRVPLGRRITSADLGSVLIGGALFIFMASVFFSGIMPKSKTVQLSAIAVVVFVVVLRLIRNNIKITLRPAGVLTLSFLVFVLLNQGEALFNGVDGFWLPIFFLCFAAAVLLSADSPDWLKFIVRLLGVFALIHAIATIIFFIFPHLYTGWFKPHFYPSAYTATGYKSGLCNHYSHNGMYLAWGLISTFYFWQTAGQRSRGKWQTAAVLILIALLLTTKRAHLVFGVASCLVIYMLLNNGKGSFGTAFKLVALLAVAMILIYIVSLFVPEVTAVIDRLNGAELDGGRSSYYYICLELFGSSPLVGHGWESFTTTLYQSGIADLARLYRNGNLNQNAHDVYLQLLAEEGLVGLILFLSLAIAALVNALGGALSDSGGNSRGLCVMAVGIQFFFLLYCITGNPLYDVAEYSVYLMAGLAPFLVHVPAWKIGQTFI